MSKQLANAGKVFQSNKCGRFKVLAVVKNIAPGTKHPHRYKIKFIKTGTELLVPPQAVSSGHIKDPYHPSVYGKGYLGVGKHIATKNSKSTLLYNTWRNMLQRCYDENFKMRKFYAGVEVCPRWLCFQSFAEDVTKMRLFGEPGSELDKDILIPGNKLYSPDTCRFIPRELNAAIVSVSNMDEWRSRKAKELLALRKKHGKSLDKQTVKRLDAIIRSLS